jgi:hypothetical protein
LGFALPQKRYGSALINAADIAFGTEIPNVNFTAVQYYSHNPVLSASAAHVGFVMDNGAHGSMFLSTSVFPCQYHLINGPYSFIFLP